MNLFKIIFTATTCQMAIFGGAIPFFEKILPLFMRRLFCYGKLSEQNSYPLLIKVEVPKKWFQHLYIFAAPLSAYALYLTVNKYFYNQDIPESIYSILDFLLGSDRQPLVSPAHTLLAITLMTIQMSKRLYESHFVNVFSDAKMNLVQYIMSFIHYIFVVAVIVGESDIFVKGSEMKFQNSLFISDWISATIFLWASYHQLQSNYILSSLRKNEEGVVVTKEYKIPSGGLFDYISNPLQFTEIVLYGCLQIILKDSSSYPVMFAWVVTNQFVHAFLSHQWLKSTFKNYPSSRKIIIPYYL